MLSPFALRVKSFTISVLEDSTTVILQQRCVCGIVRPTNGWLPH